MRVIVTGGRNYQHRYRVFEELDRLHREHRFSQLIEGGARGADQWAKEWALERGVSLTEVEADWALYGNRAGPIRNRAMLELGPDLVVAFPGGMGTDNMVRQAYEARVRVVFL